MATALLDFARQEYLGPSTSHLGDGGYEPCYIQGVAYAHGMKFRTTDTLNPKIKNPHKDPNYLWDPAVRLTHEQMSEDLSGKPMLIEHNWEWGPVGQIILSWMDEENRLNIIAETDQKKELGRWLTRKVKAGVFNDLSIGYDTRVEEGTRKVVHKGVEEVSFVIGGYFPGCEVKVRASKNQTYKDSEGDFKSEYQKNRLQIVKVMATNATQQQQQTPPPSQSSGQAPEGGAQPMEVDPSSLGNLSMEDQVRLVQMVAKMKKENEDLKRKEESWSAEREAWEHQEKKRREDYAKSKEKEYNETMSQIEEVTKADGAELAEADKTAFNALAFNPESAGVWNPLVKVTASNMSLRAQLSKLSKENEELKKNHELTRGLLQLDDSDRDDRRAQKVERRMSEQKQVPGMEPDPKGQAQLPSWISGLLGVPDTVLRVHGVERTPEQRTPTQVILNQDQHQQALPAQVPHDQHQQQVPPMQTGGAPSMTADQAPAQQKVPATAGLRYQRSNVQPFRGANPSIKYPVNEDSMRNQGTHSDVWGYIRGLGNVPLEGVGAHIAGRNFGEIH